MARLTNTTNNIPILNQALQDIATLKQQVSDLQTTVNNLRLPIAKRIVLNFGTIGAHAQVNQNVSISGVTTSMAAFVSPNAALSGPGATGSLVWNAYIINDGIVGVSLTNTSASASATPGAVLWTIIVI